MSKSSAPIIQMLLSELVMIRVGVAVQYESLSMLVEQNSTWCLLWFATLRCLRLSSSSMVTCSVSMGQCQMVLSMC